MASLPARRDPPLPNRPVTNLSRSKWTRTLSHWEAAVVQAMQELDEPAQAPRLTLALSPAARRAHFSRQDAGNRERQLAGIGAALNSLIPCQELRALRTLSAAFAYCFGPECALGP